VRLRTLQAELGGRLVIRWRAFPLRPAPDPTATFQRTYREQAWRRCADLARDTGVTYRMWERPDYPAWSLPALEAAKCVALQGDPLFEALHLRLYRAFFAESVNIGVREEVASVVRDLPGLDVDRFVADYEAGKGRAAVLEDYEAAMSEHGVRAIPTVVLGGGRRIVGAVSLAEYRRALAS
jgi:predicted DsbA family dithiol-disulfide isomerase